MSDILRLKCMLIMKNNRDKSNFFKALYSSAKNKRLSDVQCQIVLDIKDQIDRGLNPDSHANRLTK